MKSRKSRKSSAGKSSLGKSLAWSKSAAAPNGAEQEDGEWWDNNEGGSKGSWPLADTSGVLRF